MARELSDMVTTWVAPKHWDRNKYDCFNNLIEMNVEIWEIVLFTRATPGSSIVIHNFLPMPCNKHKFEGFFSKLPWNSHFWWPLFVTLSYSKLLGRKAALIVVNLATSLITLVSLKGREILYCPIPNWHKNTFLWPMKQGEFALLL